ncbi:hypothetical protein PRUPE_3G033700 [Prunus persica]|uniref:Helicase C-terminal domain-containing protein n=1 Tax=Prunus persica TaxID=3760 RepID=A0A251PUU1_PRUPE|nr:hypothetical protein PRUPE_3G033700 [Prunus persica]
MKTIEACTRRGMWCASDMKRQKKRTQSLHSQSNLQNSNTWSQGQMNIQGSFLVCQKKPNRWFFNLKHTLQFGIGLHHAGLNDKDRSLVEELFANNKVLVCTRTLAWGVNILGHHLVIIKVRQNLCSIFFLWFLYLQRFLVGVYCSSCSSGKIYLSVDSLARNRIL